MIYYLVYLSSAKKLLSESDLSDILSKSRINNTSKQVTGLLIYFEGNILQVLEGEKETVNELYLKIEKDDRHCNIFKMISGTTEERNFPDWSMGFKAVSNNKWEELSGYLKLNPANILSHLTHEKTKINTIINSFVTANRM